MIKWDVLKTTIELLIEVNGDAIEKIFEATSETSEILTDQNKTLMTILRVMNNLDEKEKESDIK